MVFASLKTVGTDLVAVMKKIVVTIAHNDSKTLCRGKCQGILRIGHLHVCSLIEESSAGRFGSTILYDDLSRDEVLSLVVHIAGNSRFVRDVMPSPSTVFHIPNN